MCVFLYLPQPQTVQVQTDWHTRVYAWPTHSDAPAQEGASPDSNADTQK